MDENNTGFAMDDWGDIDVSDVVDNTEDVAEPEAQQDEADPAETAEPEQTQEPTQQQEADQSFQLKYMGEMRNVSRDEVVTLAQKGMDYDRIRGKLDEVSTEREQLTETVSYLQELAASQNISLDQLVDSTRAAMLARENKISLDEAVNQVRLERRERDLAKREEKLAQQNAQAETQRQETEKRQADIRQFLSAFPGVDPKSIPKEVWAAVSSGSTLTEAYARHENAQLKMQLEAERKNRENQERTTGSRSTAGNKPKEDPFDKLWYEDD